MPSYRGRSFTFRAESSARGWDAGDEYVLSYLEDPGRIGEDPGAVDEDTGTIGEDPGAVGEDPGRVDPDRPPPGGIVPRILLVNDSGAVTVGLAGQPRDVWADSYLGRETIRRNLGWNAARADEVTLLGADAFGIGRDPSARQVRRGYDLVLVRVPRERELLQSQLVAVRPFLTGTARAVAYGMTRHLFPNLRELLAAVVGPTRVTAVVKHAVLLIADVSRSGGLEADQGADAMDSGTKQPAFTFRTFSVDLPDGAATIYTLPGTFSHGALDPGTRLLLQHLRAPAAGATVVDLGCGSGILGLALLRLEPRIALHLVDVSELALLSARRTFVENGMLCQGAARHGSDGTALAELSVRLSDGVALEPRFHFDDGLRGFEEGSVDLVVSNPPFHRLGAFDPNDTRRLLRQAQRALRPGGELRLVTVHGARVEGELRALFAHTERVASDRRFAVHSCLR